MMNTRRLMTGLWMAFMATAIVGCVQDGDTLQYDVSLVLDGIEGEDVDHIQLYLLEECPPTFEVPNTSTSLFEAALDRSEDPQPVELPRLDPGEYALMAIASDRDCRVLAGGCRNMVLEDEGDGDSELVVAALGVPIECEFPSSCSAQGVCGYQAPAPDPDFNCTISTPPTRPILDVKVGSQHSCVLFDDGAGGFVEGIPYCWGNNSEQQISLGGAPSIPDPQQAGSFSPENTIVAGGDYTCSVNDGGTGIRCNGSVNGNNVSAQYLRLPVAGPVHACAIYSLVGNELLGCWGGAETGYLLGARSTTGLGRHMIADIEDVVAIGVGGQAGENFTCVATATEVRCAGAGPGGGVSDLLPLAWVGQSVLVMDGGDRHVCLIDSGELYCWGDNDAGQLGVDSLGIRVDLPARVGTRDDWVAIAAGGDTTCGIAGTSLYCWGANDLGQAGDGPTTTRRPRLLDDFGSWSHVDVGERHACGVRNGVVQCWGDNSSGQLGVDAAIPFVLHAEEVCFN